MQLVYGKFDPDVHLPSFDDWSKNLTAVEIDLFQYYSWKPKVVAYFQSWVKRKGILIIPRIGLRVQRSIEEYQDAVSVWRETYDKETIRFLVHSGRKSWNQDQSLKEIKKLPKTEKCFFEWGKDDSAKGVEFIKPLDCFKGWVIDPDWHRSFISRLGGTLLNFKLHGWSEVRWIRRYGESQSAKILRVVQKRKGSVLTLSYSGKVAEAVLFTNLKLDYPSNQC